MNVPGVAWVSLILILIPVIQSFVSMQWPEQSYAITALVVGILGALAKWLQMYFTPSTSSGNEPQVLPTPNGVMGAAAPASTSSATEGESPSRVRTWLIG